MTRFIVEFWPVTIPILVFGGWYFFVRKKDVTKGHRKLTQAEAKLWIWTLALSLIIALICLIILAFSTTSNKEAEYIPPHMEDGKLIPGQIIKQDETKP